MISKIYYEILPTGEVVKTYQEGEIYSGQVAATTHFVKMADGNNKFNWLPTDLVFINFTRPDGEELQMRAPWGDGFWTYVSNGTETDVVISEPAELPISWTAVRVSAVDGTTRTTLRPTQTITAIMQPGKNYRPQNIDNSAETQIRMALNELEITKLTRVDVENINDPLYAGVVFNQDGYKTPNTEYFNYEHTVYNIDRNTGEQIAIDAVGSLYVNASNDGGQQETFKSNGKIYTRVIFEPFEENDVFKEELLFPKVLQTGGNLFVNNQSYVDEEDGSLYAPFKTIQAAVDASRFGDTIRISAGEYVEDIVIDNKQNITITTDSTIGQYRIVVDGDLMVSNSLRIGLGNIELKDYTQNNSALIYVDNMAAETATFSGAVSGHTYSRFDFCFFGDLRILPEAQYNIDLLSSEMDGGKTWSIESALASLTLTNCRQVSLEHSAGALITLGGTLITTSRPDKVGIDSTSNAGALVLFNCTLMLGDGTYAKINKTGNAPYLFGTVLREPTQDVLTGTRIDGGLHADDLYAHLTTVNYTRDSDTILSHLVGIDSKFGELGTELTSIIEQLAGREHFRGYFATTAEILALDGTNGDFAYSAETLTKWVYSDGWSDSGVAVPDQLVPKSTTLPLMNGVAAVGSENAYSAGNHVHPSDTNKVDKFQGTANQNKVLTVGSDGNITLSNQAPATGVVDNLTSTSTSLALSANQGRILNVNAGATNATVSTIQSTVNGLANGSGLPFSSSTPSQMTDGSGSVGTANALSRSDHRHGQNYRASIPAMNGAASAGSENTVSRGDHVHGSDTSKANINGDNADATSWVNKLLTGAANFGDKIVSITKGQRGGIKFASGLIINWNTENATTAVGAIGSSSFAYPFSSNVSYAALVGVIYAGTNWASEVYVYSKAAANFQYYKYSNANAQVNWVAIGY